MLVHKISQKKGIITYLLGWEGKQNKWPVFLPHDNTAHMCVFFADISDPLTKCSLKNTKGKTKFKNYLRFDFAKNVNIATRDK